MVFFQTIILEELVIFTLHLVDVKIAIVDLAISALIFGIILACITSQPLLYDNEAEEIELNIDNHRMSN